MKSTTLSLSAANASSVVMPAIKFNKAQVQFMGEGVVWKSGGKTMLIKHLATGDQYRVGMAQAIRAIKNQISSDCAIMLLTDTDVTFHNGVTFEFESSLDGMVFTLDVPVPAPVTTKKGR